ncbi:MAG: hypothetical protein QW607_08510 [Desulfurococcaceae archaeon]
MDTLIDKNIYQTNTELESESVQHTLTVFREKSADEIVEAIVDLLDTYLLVFNLDQSDKYNTAMKIWFLTSKWIELIGSVKYIPQLITEIANFINKKLWDSGIDYDLLREVLLKTYLIKKKEDTIDLNEYRNIVYCLITQLGYSGNSILIDELLKSNDPDNLISIAVLSIILSTNMD